MMALASNSNACAQWAVDNFGSVKLGDKRRTRRVVRFGEALAMSPGASIPKVFESTYDAVAVYDFLSRPEATPDNLQKCHRELVAERIENQTGTVLAISDITTISFSQRGKIESLGPVGDMKHGGQGFLVHSTIVARYCDEHETEPEDKRAPLEILGLADQTYVVRSRDKDRSKRTVRKDDPEQWKESFLWEESVPEIKTRSRENLRIVHVADRESDIFEMFAACDKNGHGFVIRANQNRALDGRPGEHLFETARSHEAMGEFLLDLRARPGKAARTVKLKLSCCPAMLRAPYRKSVQQLGAAQPARVWAVRVWEESDDPEALEWILLTDQEATNAEQAHRVARIYSCRWVIEEFHKALKTGLGAERLQLETAHRLQAAVAIFSVVALRLLVMRETLKQNPDAPAERAGLTQMELTVLSVKSKKPINTVKDAVYAIARMGGHFPHNGDPGWQTLWHGMNKLKNLVEGAFLAKELLRFDQ